MFSLLPSNKNLMTQWLICWHWRQVGIQNNNKSWFWNVCVHEAHFKRDILIKNTTPVNWIKQKRFNFSYVQSIIHTRHSIIMRKLIPFMQGTSVCYDFDCRSYCVAQICFFYYHNIGRTDSKVKKKKFQNSPLSNDIQWYQ